MTTLTAPPQSKPHTHVGLALTALALGGFAIGTTEFVTMGLLPEIAGGIDRSIPVTGQVISAYALGVVVGAPVIVSLGARLPRRGLAVALLLAMGLGNALTALAAGYPTLLAARFLAGLPHGAYFGVAALLAVSLVPPDKRGRAVGSVMLGLSVATVVGVPASTFLGQSLGWRSAYWLVVVIMLLAALLVIATVPSSEGDPGASVRGELRALKRPQVLFAAGAGMIGFGGLFAMYSYIAPIVTDVTDLSRHAIPWFLLAFGVGSVLGTWVAGRLADWNTVRSILGGFAATVLILVMIYALAPYAVPTLFTVFALAVVGSIIAINLQLRLMHVAGDAQMLGAALNHSALNTANALGAFAGALVIEAGFGYRAPSLVGAGLALVGLIVFGIGLAYERRTVSPATA